MLSLLHALPPALCFTVPLFSAVLLVSLGRNLLAWSAILSFAVLASAAGIIGLSASSGLFSLSKAQLVVQTSLYTELGASVLYLTYKYSSPTPWHTARDHIKPYTLLLSAFLFCATTLGLTTPFVPAIPAIIPPLVFMLFTLSTLPLLAHLIHTHLFPPIPPNARIYSPVSKSIQNQIPKQNLKQNPSPPSLPKLNTAITVLIPPPLPSPASSSASFPSSSDQTHKPEKPTQDHQNSTPGSSYSAALPAKRANLAGSSCTADTHADIEAGSSSGGTAPESTSTPSSSGPISRIRKRAIRLRIQARNILLTLFLSQLCALLSGALLLVLGVTDGSFSQTTALLRIIETVFMVLCVCGFEVAFFLHARRLEGTSPSSIRSQGPPATTSIPLSISAPGQDQDIVDADADYEDTNPQKTQDEEDEEGAEVNLDMIPLPDAGDYTEKGAAPTAKNVRGLGFGAQKRFRIFSGGVGDDAISNRQQHHRRFTSVSSSFSSPRPRRTPITVPSGFDHAHGHVPLYFCQRQEEQEVVVEDEGIELPVLSKTMRRARGAQLPSPPDTPRVGDGGMDARPGWYHHHYQLESYHHQYDQQFRQYGQQQLYDDQLYHHQFHQRPREEEEEEDEVRIGLASPEIKVNVHHHLIESSGTAAFLDVEHHTDVVDTAVSEPGCMGDSRSSSSGSVFMGEREEHVQNGGGGDPRSPRVLFSCPQRVTQTPVKVVLPKSPSLSFLSPVKSPLSLSFSLGSPRSPKSSILGGGSGSPSSSRSTWRRAEKIRERLRRRPLSSGVGNGSGTGSAGPARSASTSTSGGHHRRNASLKMGEWEWYPFTSKARASRESAREAWEEMNVAGGGGTAGISGASGAGGMGSTSARGGVVDADTADFVDLTDPFASPTPGFTLPKWVNSATTTAAATGSVSDAGHASQGHGYGEEAGRSGKGKAKLEYDCVQDGEDAGEGKYREFVAEDDAVVRVGGALMKTKMTAWGKLPVVVDTFASSGSGSGHGYEYGHATQREEVPRTMGATTTADFPVLLRDDAPTLMRKGRGEVTMAMAPPRKEKARRPDSPMPMIITGSGSSSLPKVPARSGGRRERADSPMPMPMVDLGRIQGRASAFRTPLLVGQVPRSQQQQQHLLVQFPVEDSESVEGFGSELGSGNLSRGEEPGIPSARLRRGRNGSPVPLKTSPTIRRKGSPVPILFRPSPATGGRHHPEVAVGGDENGMQSPRGWKKALRGRERRQLEEREEAGLDLGLEEMLLAQRLLRRLDSVYSLESGGGV